MQTHGENNWGCCCMSHTAPAKNGSVSLWEEGSTCSLVRSFHSRSLILLSKENSESVHSTLDGWTCCSVNITHQQTQKMFFKKNVFNTLCCANSRYSQTCCCCRRHFIWFPLAKSLDSGMYHLHNMKAFSCLLLCTVIIAAQRDKVVFTSTSTRGSCWYLYKPEAEHTLALPVAPAK